MATDPDSILSVTTTVGADEDARRLAGAALERRLAACVQVDRIESHYRWDGALQAAAEWRLTFKTTAARLPALRELLRQEHPYDLPQLTWHACDASPGYAAWVRQEVAGLTDD